MKIHIKIFENNGYNDDVISMYCYYKTDVFFCYPRQKYKYHKGMTSIIKTENDLASYIKLGTYRYKEIA